MISLGRRAIGDSKPSWSFRTGWTSEDYLSVRRAGWSELLLQFPLKLLDSLFGSLFLPTEHCNSSSQQLFSLFQLCQECLPIRLDKEASNALVDGRLVRNLVEFRNGFVGFLGFDLELLFLGH